MRMRACIVAMCVGAGAWSAAGEQPAKTEPGASPAPTPASAPAPAAAPSAPAAEPVAKPKASDRLRAEAEKLRPVVTSDLARAFLAATATLPEPPPRSVFRDKERTKALTATAAAKLPEAERAALSERACDANFYYYTGYGSPLVYARVVDVLAGEMGAGVKSLAGKRVLDFGYGTIGHLRLMGAMGCDAHGVDVEPLFGALYAEPGDQGTVAGHAGAPDGRVTVHTGRWPADAEIKAAVGGGYDIITSKNTLKKSYIHPERAVDERMLVKLGVEDDAFVRAVFEALNPGGVFLIYNIAPAQNPPDQPYLPHADGRSPFPREMLERAGFEVVDFDLVDTEALLGYWKALGYGNGKPREETMKDLFAHYTLCRRPLAKK